VPAPGAPASGRPARRLRILHLGFEDHRRPGSGGGSARNQQINSRLAQRHDITVLTTKWRGCVDRTEDGVRYVHIGLPIGYYAAILSYFAVLPFAIRRYEADLVVEEFAAPFSSALIPLWTRRPTLALVQWLNSKEKSRQYKMPFLLFEQLGVRVHRRFVAVSGDVRDRLRHINPTAVVDVIPNGVEAKAFDVTPTSGDDVVFLGRLEQEQKGLDLLLDAYARVARHIGGQLLIAGDGPDRRKLERRVARLGITDRVRFLGRVSGTAKYELLARARLVVMPSRFETFGIVAIEALACGTPVLAFRIPCLQAVIPDDCGRMVGAYSVPDYAAAMAEMYDSAELTAMGVAGRRFARGFDWDQIALRQEDSYRATARGPERLRARFNRPRGASYDCIRQ
jgi:glycosyltransferase involved in cell wall biosynthesis